MFTQKEMSVSILRWPYVFFFLRATVMAASFVRLIVCLCNCDLRSICVMVCARGFTTPAPGVLLPLTFEPSGLIFCCGVWCMVLLLFSVIGFVLVCLGMT